MSTIAAIERTPLSGSGNARHQRVVRRSGCGPVMGMDSVEAFGAAASASWPWAVILQA